MSDHRAIGDYQERPIVGSFDPRIADVLPTNTKYGLGLGVQYFYGGLRDDEGNLAVLERKFVSSMTSGLWLMSNRGAEHLKLVPGALRTARGEIRRHFTPESHRYTDALMAKVGKDLVPEGEQPLDLTFADGGITWSEGDLLSCDVLVDHAYLPTGREWKEFRFFTQSQVSWNVFANEYDDGTIEAGFFIQGLNDFAVAGAFDNKGPRFATSELSTSLTLDEDDWMAASTYDAGGEQWDFTPDRNARMNEFSSARWAGYRAQAGVTRRRGDTRSLTASFTWLEFFADRARAGGFVTAR
ncbi:MAG: hypothetical protein LC792_29420 [Actinobacteria bacterium]|nr:hypothetical protein [Actinomycetota bacterium]